EKGCLKCHAEQGYEIGDIRGGISESVPMSSLWTVERSHLLTLFMGHSLLWLIGLVGIGLGTRRLSKQIAERKKAEEARHFTQFAIDHSSEAAFWMASDARFIYVNEAACHALGYSEEELLQMTVHDIDPDFPQEVWPDHWAELKRRGSFTVESHHRTKEGRIFPVDITVNFLEFSGKEFNCAFVKDITERKQAEEELQKLASIVKYSSELINLATLDGKMIFLNKAGSKMLGIDSDKVEQVHIMEVIPDDLKELVQTELLPALMEGDTWEGDLKYRNIKTGELRDVHVMAFTVKEPNTKKPLFLANVSIDITERKRAVEEKAKLEAQLQQAQKMESMGTLAGGIAHDFNNLLMGIQGRASLMMMDVDSSHPYNEHLKGIEDYVKSAADLTKQLLGFARGGKYEVKAIDLNKLIINQNRMFGRTRKEINIQEKFEKDLWATEVDQGQIEQVLLNLYVNSWQAMPGGGDLYVQTENIVIDESFNRPYHVEQGKYVKVSVTDTGVGMDEATQQRIFDPFFTTKEMGRGTGLGLASVYGIIKSHGGSIDVFSEKGEGTTFNIYLPASEKEIVKEKKPQEEVLKGAETTLLVDDEDMILDVGRGIMEKLGYKVLTAKSGEEAIGVYEKNHDKIDMVILDMVMPGMGGGETYDKLKEINPGIKVLLSSGYSINGQASEILDRGCNGFIQKPFNVTDLAKSIRKVLDKD
ncbi:MAG: PAS domain S-box protein, partial [Deltaproteobacteria bacterium]|nr:PAS domain S-box protein [Deltaproteobacteria bacterium]